MVSQSEVKNLFFAKSFPMQKVDGISIWFQQTFFFSETDVPIMVTMYFINQNF